MASAIHLNHSIIVKSQSLLPMQYKVSEIAKHINTPDRTVRDWLVKGLPHERDSRNHILINGKEFAIWIKQQRARKQKNKLATDEGLCMKCKTKVSPVAWKNKQTNAYFTILRGTCPICSTTISKGTQQ